MSYSWGPWDDLLTLSHALAGSNSVSFTDSYSPAHQILQSQISNTAYQFAPPTPGTTSHTPNGLNQYTSVTPPGGGAAVTMSYDAIHLR